MSGDAVLLDGGLPDTTVDAFIGGRVEAVQPTRGHHRSGLEAVFLGASVGRDFSGIAVDLGAGAGVAGMVLAARCPGATVALAERDETAIACARAALHRPANGGFAARVTMAMADIEAPEAAREAAGLKRAAFDLVITNPPFHAAGAGSPPPGVARAAAHILGGGGLDAWMRVAASVLRPGGRLVVAFRADRLPDLLAAMDGRFGAVTILPLLPRGTEPAHRVLVRAVKGSRAAASLLPAIVLHGARGGAYLAPVERVLRDGAALEDIHPAWNDQLLRGESWPSP